MKPSELYKLKEIGVETDIYSLRKCLDGLDDLSYEGVESIEGLEQRIHGFHSFDGERSWELSSIWYKDRPFMVLQEAGRGGDDHVETFLTDKEVLKELKLKIAELLDQHKKTISFSPDEDIEDLDCFYGHELSEFYNPNINPRYKVDDIVIASVPKNHLNYSDETVTTRVKIQIVNPTDPTYTYHGLQIDRRWSDDSFGQGKPSQMIIDINNGKVGCEINDELIDHEATANLK